MSTLAPLNVQRAHVGHNPLGSNPVAPAPDNTEAANLAGKSATKQTLQDVQAATRDVLTRIFPECLSLMGFEDAVSVSIDDTSRLIEVCGVRYTLTFAGSTIRLWVGLNVYRVIVILFLERDHLCDPGLANAVGDALIPHALMHAIRGARHVGYEVHVEPATVEGCDVLSLWMTNWMPKNFLSSPMDQVFIGQDLALMIQSLCRAAARDNLKLQSDVDPRPL
ncbi:MAG: hypothetical protein BGP25_05010 [Lysobacterales bacterium 63-13]|nr:MAG: hypothetical protein BGP25_05010 [Xanthomonadales bacterium 63-13]